MSHGHGYTPAVVGWAWAKRGRILDLPACYLDAVAQELSRTRLPDEIKHAAEQVQANTPSTRSDT